MNHVDALCCLLSSVVASAADAGATAFQHVYPTANMTWPYCDHHAVIGRELDATTNPPPTDFVEGGNWDARGGLKVSYARFEVGVVRCGPPSPEPGQCLDEIYGECGAAAGVTSFASHYTLVHEERERLRLELLGRWCDCLHAADQGYSRTWPRWVESIHTESMGRFTVTVFTVAALLD